MEVETSFAKHIDAAEGKASYDASCKRLLANKEILARIMKACLHEYRDCDIKDIVGRYIEGDPHVAMTAVNPDEKDQTGEDIKGMNTVDSTMTEGSVLYDIRFFAVVPTTGEYVRLIVNVEVQNKFNVGYPIVKRGIYYCSRMISAQYGTEFAHSQYEKIRKVYSIWVCTDTPKRRKNTVTHYKMTEENMIGNMVEKVENYDLLTVILICLGDSDDEGDKGILRLLSTLFSNESKAEEKKRVLRDDFGITMTRTLESEVERMCNLSEGVEARGIEKGIEKGIEIEKTEGTIRSIRKLMKNLHITLEQALSVLEIPEEEHQKYVDVIVGE